jgi:8-oxo-dGTP pyrophosphatase MutT (NUDIX family)
VATDAIIHPAATVIVMRDSLAGPEVFMVRRHHAVAFMAGAHVFPGGRVDAGDRGATDRSCDGVEPAQQQFEDVTLAETRAYYAAAARELFEEAGVLLARTAEGEFVRLSGDEVHARFKQYRADLHGGRRTLRDIAEAEGLRLAFDALVPLAHWVTPPVDTRRFDTRFFATRVPPHQTPAHDDTEATQSAWMTPSRAIEAAIARQIVLPPPTWATLQELQPFTCVDDALAWARARTVRRREPTLIEDNGTRMLVLPGDALNPHPEGVPFETRFIWAEDRWWPESLL